MTVLIVLKIIGWIIAVILIIIALVLVTTLILMSIKIKLKCSINEEAPKDFRFRMQYGFLNLKIYPEQFTEEKRAKFKKLIEKLKEKFIDEDKKEISKIENQLKAEEKQIEDFNERKDKRKLLGENPSKIDEIIYEIRQVDFKKIKDLYEKLQDDFSKEDLSEIFSYILDKTAKLPAKLKNKFVIEQLFFILNFGCADDAAKGAIEYGSICSIVYPFFGKLASGFKLREYDIDITPDFLTQKNDFTGAFVCSFRLINFISIFMVYGITIFNKTSSKFLKNKIKNKRKVKNTKQIVKNN